MDYTLRLRSQEPCDIFLTSFKKNLYAIVVESRNAYIKVLDSNTNSNDFSLVCAKHRFAHSTLSITVVDDFALIDGTACVPSKLSPAAMEVFANEVSNC